MPAYGLRFTPLDLSGYSFDWIKEQKHCIAEEIGAKTHKLHYQMYISVECSESTLRNNIRKSLKIPPGLKGKDSAYYTLSPDWHDWTYTLKDTKVISQNIVEPRELPELIAQAAIKFAKKEEQPTTPTNTIIERIEKTDHVWDRLLFMYDEGAAQRDIGGNKQNKYASYSYSDFRNWICAHYLRQRKPIPRGGDLHRYAFSLFLLKEQDVSGKKIDEATIEKYKDLL